MPRFCVALTLTALFLTGCTDKTPADPQSTAKAVPEAPAKPAPTATETHPKPAVLPTSGRQPTATENSKGVISFSALAPSTVPTAVQTKGTVDHAIEWSDKNGRNIVTFTSFEKKTAGHLSDRTLHINHDVVSGDGARRLRTVKDGIKTCEFDVHAKMVKQALGVTDLDGDGLGEVTFAYLTTCTSDVSPMTLKLLLLEDGAKYIIRGTNVIDMGAGNLEGGDKVVDPSVTQGPAPFSTHLDTMWGRIVSPWSPGGQFLGK